MSNHEQRRAVELRETYLAEVEQSLRRRLAPLETYETIEELRVHLSAMTAAHEELGMTSEAAMAASLGKFGPAKEIGGSLSLAALEGEATQVVNESARAFASAVLLGVAIAFVVGWKAEVVDQQLVSHGLWTLPSLLLALSLAILVALFASIFPRWGPIKVGLASAFVLNFLLSPALIHHMPFALTFATILSASSVALAAASCAPFRRLGSLRENAKR